MRMTLDIVYAPGLDFAPASSSDMNQFSFKHSCRNLPLKDSSVVLSVGILRSGESLSCRNSVSEWCRIWIRVRELVAPSMAAP